METRRLKEIDEELKLIREKANELVKERLEEQGGGYIFEGIVKGDKDLEVWGIEIPLNNFIGRIEEGWSLYINTDNIGQRKQSLTIEINGMRVEFNGILDNIGDTESIEGFRSYKITKITKKVIVDTNEQTNSKRINRKNENNKTR